MYSAPQMDSIWPLPVKNKVVSGWFHSIHSSRRKTCRWQLFSNDAHTFKYLIKQVSNFQKQNCICSFITSAEISLSMKKCFVHLHWLSRPSRTQNNMVSQVHHLSYRKEMSILSCHFILNVFSWCCQITNVFTEQKIQPLNWYG